MRNQQRISVQDSSGNHRVVIRTAYPAGRNFGNEREVSPVEYTYELEGGGVLDLVETGKVKLRHGELALVSPLFI